MKIFLTIVRVGIALLAAVVLFVTVAWFETPQGRTISVPGAITDAVALVVLVAMILWLWLDRRNVV